MIEESDVAVGKRDKQVEVQLKQQESIIGGLETQVDHFYASLAKALSEQPQDEEKDKEAVAAEVVLCPLADQIRGHNYRLQKMDKALIQLLSRLEV